MRTFPIAVVLAIVASSCANGVDDGGPQGPSVETATPFKLTTTSAGAPQATTIIAAQEQAATYSSQDVGAIVAAIRSGEASRAELARTRAQSSLIQGYASRLASKAGNGPAPSDPLAMSIARQDTASIAALLHLEGSTFDTEYISSEVSLEARTLALIDHTLMPSVIADPNSLDPVRDDVTALRNSAAERLMDALDTQQQLRGRADARDPDRLF